MPMYEFECSNCGFREDKIVTFARADEPLICPLCGDDSTEATMQRVDRVYSPSHQFKGKWFANTGSY